MKPPKARHQRLLVQHVADETVVYDLDSKEAHCLKSVAAVAFAHADGSRSAQDIAAIASDQLSRQVSESDLLDAVAQLEERGLMESAPLTAHDDLSRRDALRKFAVAGAGAVMITTVMAPVALATGGGTTCDPASTELCGKGTATISGCTACTSSASCGAGMICCCVPCDSSYVSGCCQKVCVPGGHSKTCEQLYTAKGYKSPVGTGCPTSYCFSYQSLGYTTKCCNTSLHHCNDGSPS